MVRIPLSLRGSRGRSFSTVQGAHCKIIRILKMASNGAWHRPRRFAFLAALKPPLRPICLVPVPIFTTSIFLPVLFPLSFPIPWFFWWPISIFVLVLVPFVPIPFPIPIFFLLLVPIPFPIFIPTLVLIPRAILISIPIPRGVLFPLSIPCAILFLIPIFGCFLAYLLFGPFFLFFILRLLVNYWWLLFVISRNGFWPWNDIFILSLSSAVKQAHDVFRHTN
mmetsp:Transcript_65535/g.116622  ORF Transcript_65535/g.116622 Transcript_65535/m.116622 type:complete len:222 (+) Transcript_65535:2926-3591(+)